ncbi:MAG: sugar ABC transporter permease [Sphaerochaeta sp.]
MREPEFIGFENYTRFAASELFWKVMRNTLLFSLMTVVPAFFIGLGFAMLVNKQRAKGIGFYRTSFFYPVMMPMIAIASIWLFMYMQESGMVDQFMLWMGRKPIAALSNRSTVLPALSVMYVWREAGYLMIFFLSGLQSLDPEIFEAALIDGSSPLRTFRKITLPLLAPTTLFVTITALTDSLKLVDHIVIMTEGAPNNASTLLLYYIYQHGFIFFDQAKASALTMVMLIIMLTISMGQFLNQDKKIYYN